MRQQMKDAVIDEKIQHTAAQREHVKNTFWTEYATAKVGDMIALGESSAATPPDDADEVRHIIRYADTFERIADDYAIMTGV